MAVRAGMTNVLLKVREMTNAGTSDYVVGGVTYFTDQQLQDECDKQRATWYDVELVPVPRRVAPNTTQWLDYNIPDEIGDWFEESAVSGVWTLKDAFSNTIATSDYTVSYLAKTVTLNADALGAPRYLDCNAYDLNRVAAAVWREKAALEMRSIDWSNNGMVIKASQRRDHCLTMADFYVGKSGMNYSTMIRTDEL